MSIEDQNMNDNDLELSFFNFEDNDLDNTTLEDKDSDKDNKDIEDNKDENQSDDPINEKDEDEIEDLKDEDDDIDNNDSDDNIDSTDDVLETKESLQYDSIMAELIEQGSLFLPEDYEYEPTKEGISKALEDSESYRNETAFQEAIKWLISEEGLDFVKIKSIKENMNAFDNVDSLDTDSKIDIIKNMYQKQGMDESEIDEITEELIYDDKLLNSQLKLAVRVSKKEKENELKEITDEPITRKQNSEREQRENQQLIKSTLGKDEINGYVLPSPNREKIYKSLYSPVKNNQGDITTEFTERLKMAMGHPETLVVLADLLLSIDDKGFNFKTLNSIAETKSTNTLKKSIRDIQNSGGKQRMSRANTQTRKDFDLSKASLF
jgi:hypothetical protein